MFELNVRTHFCAAHHLVGYRGDCAANHGHTWEVTVFVSGERLDDNGFLIDFRDLKNTVGKVVKTLDHSDLNALDTFQKDSPTSENIARFLFTELSDKLNTDRVRVSRISVQETPGVAALYSEDK